MTSAIADQPVRSLVLAAGLALSLSACSSSTEDTGQELGATTEETTSLTTSTVSTTTTTEATTTTLSELQIAEAEVEQVVIDWWTFPLDTSVEGNADQRSELTTGLLQQRGAEYLASLDTDGFVFRKTEDSPIQVTDVTVDLDGGTAEITACLGSDAIIVDAETQGVETAEDPDDKNISTFQLELEDDRWKIYEFLPSVITDNPIPCEINP